jgi:hypothetical protein
MISSVAIEIYNSLNDKRNCISKYTRIKKAVPKEFVQILQGDKKGTIILPFQSDLKFIHKILQKIKPVYQIKWGALYGEDINKGISLSKIKTGTCTK